MKPLTLKELVHIFENSQIQTQLFTQDAADAAYIEALAAMQEKLAAETPLTLDKLRTMNGEPVWIVAAPDWGHWEFSEDADDYLEDRDPDFYGMMYPNDPEGMYGLHLLGWLAFERKPDDAGVWWRTLNTIRSENSIAYLSGPISGNMIRCKAEFAKAEYFMRQCGRTVLNPSAIPLGLKQQDYMKIGFSMVEAADEIILLDGWEQSAGAKLEAAYAEKIGKPVIKLAKLREAASTDDNDQ